MRLDPEYGEARLNLQEAAAEPGCSPVHSPGSSALAAVPDPAAFQPPAAEPAQSTSFGLLKYLGCGWVLSCFSPAFYYHAARRRKLWALVFFLLFTALLTTILSLSVAYTFRENRDMILENFASGKIPEITITGGEAVIGANEPAVFEYPDLGLKIILDSTGNYSSPPLLRMRAFISLLRMESPPIRKVSKVWSRGATCKGSWETHSFSMHRLP